MYHLKRILIDINHPAHVHFFKNSIKAFQEKGHNVIITARDKDVTIQLLKAYNLKHTVLSKVKKGVFGLSNELLLRQSKLMWILRREKIQICISIGGTFNVHAARLMSIPCLVFYDTEHARISNTLAYPFASHIITPDCYKDDLGRKQIRYAGYHELAYLYPDYFVPDISILDLLNVKQEEKYIIIRFVSWTAAHDIGKKRLSIEEKRKLIKAFSPYTKIFITSEAPLPEDLQKYRIRIPPDRIHDALAYASLYIGDGATMVSECACLGIPAIYTSMLSAGTLEEQEKKYGLFYNITDLEEIIRKGIELLESDNIKSEWQKKRERMLSDKIDVTKWMINLIEEKIKL